MISKELIEAHYGDTLKEILIRNEQFNEIIREHNRLVSYVQLVALFINLKIKDKAEQNFAIELMKPFGNDIANLKEKLNNIDIIDNDGFILSKNLSEKQLDGFDLNNISAIHFSNPNKKFFK